MNLFQSFIKEADNIQRRYHFMAFFYGVIKHYGDDQAGYLAALLTYYGFVSLFPLLLVLITLTQMIASGHPELSSSVVNGAISYFPVLGGQLSAHISGLHKSGPALIVGILFMLYGARGVAAAFRNGVSQVWGVPRKEMEGFPTSALKNVMIIIVGGIGFISAAILAAIAASAGHGLRFQLISILVNIFILFCLFTFLLKFSLPKRIRYGDIWVGAAVAALGIVALQVLGGHLLVRELKNLDALYSYFAVSLGLLFWIYLQAQVVYFAVEISVVRSRKLWPRSLSGHNPTKADANC